MAKHLLYFKRIAEVTMPIIVEASSEEEAVEVASEEILHLPTHYWETREGQTIKKKDFWLEGTR
jgi:hypothetical protein|tara:strand:+ start:139 stop:330 length:192 start_codon:yes stop_codon:yes gene_type:complete